MREKETYIDYVTGSRRLKALREEKKLSHQKLAEITGINKQSLVNYERAGKENGSEYGTRINAFGGMSVNSAVALAKAFGVSTDYLLGFPVVRSPNTDIQAINEYTGLGEDAIDALHSMNAPDNLGGDPGVLYALDRLLAALKTDECFALVDITNYLETDFDCLDISFSSVDRYGEEEVKQLTSAALEREAEAEIIQSLRELKRKYYQEVK